MTTLEIKKKLIFPIFQALITIFGHDESASRLFLKHPHVTGMFSDLFVA